MYIQNISNATELKSAIEFLEIEKKVKELLFKEQVLLSYEKMKPANLIKTTLNDVVTSPNLLDNIIGASVGMATGYLAKKIVIGTTGNFIKNIIGSILQVGVTKVVAQNPDAIKSFGQFVIQHIFPKKSKESNNHDK